MSTFAGPEIRAFFDEPTNTVSYLVWDAATMEGAVIDPVLDYDFRSGKASMASADAILAEAGKFPPAGVNGVHYLKVPVKLAS